MGHIGQGKVQRLSANYGAGDVAATGPTSTQVFIH
jgi:hypothetical protein